MKYRLRLAYFSFLALVLCLLFFVPRQAQAALVNGNTIADGVIVGDIDLSGKTLEEAKKILENYFHKVEKAKLKLYVYDNYINKDTPSRTEGQTLLNSFFIPYSELGFSWSVEETLKKAASYGQSGKLIERYKDLQNMKFDKVRLPLEYSISADAVRNYLLEKVCPEVNHGATSAKIAVSYPNVYVSEKERIGIDLNVAATTEKILLLFESGIPEDPSCTASVSYSEPQYTAETFSKMNGVLGEFTTFVDLTPETVNRTKNIEVLLENFINGSIVMPGELFSIWEALGGNTTPDKGFVPAGAFVGGTLQDEDGGGVCQGSTTLYNAVMFAELEVVERFAHSMVISYVPLAQDCALAYPYKDLKFRNNTDAPVYLESFVEGNQVVCRVYGHETRPSNRSIVFETTYVTRQLYGPEYRLESWANPGEPRVSGMPHMEADAYCTKKVLIDGVVVESQKVADDHYVPERQIIKIGCNTLDLYVKPDPSGFGYDKIYDRDNNQLLVNKEGVPFYNGYNGYLLVRDYEADADGHAYLDGNGRPIARTTPLPPTPTQPDVLRLPDYRGRYDVDAYKAELEAMGMTVLDVRYVTSSKPVGEIRMVFLSDGTTQVSPREEIQKGTEFIIMVSSGPSGQTEDPTDPAPTDPAPTDPAPTDPAPTDPAPTDPAPTDPAPTDPAPTDPAPTDPVPTDPAPTDPAPTNPEGFDVQSVVGMTVKEGTKLLATNGYNYAWPEGEGGPANDSKAIITKVEFINGDPNTVYVYFTE